MNWEALSALAAVGACATAVAGLVLVIKQLRHIEKQIRSGSAASLYNEMISIDQFFISNAHLKPYIYGEKPVDDGDELSGAVQSAAEMMVDLMEHAYLQRDSLPDGLWPRWEAYMRHLYAKSPAIREYLKTSGVWYHDNILKIIGMGRT